MALLKKNDPKRRRRSFWRHAVLLGKTFIFAGILTGLWYELWIRGCHFPEDDKDFVGLVVGILGVTYGIQLSWILPGLLEKYHKVVIAVFKEDDQTFLMYRDERMPIVIHLLVGIVSVPFLAMVGGMAYKHTLTGAISVFATSLVLTLFWLVAAQLENPVSSPWIRERVEPTWLTIDIDQHFKFFERDAAKMHHVEKT